MFPRTKIVCTIGPACAKEKIITEMIQLGMRVARLNFSHGTHEGHEEYIRLIRGISAKLGIPVAIMQDLQGPKIRVGDLPAAGIVLREGSLVHFSPRAKAYTEREQLIPVTYGGFSRDVKAGDRVLLDDGQLVCVVQRVEDQVVTAQVKVGGTLTSHKGMNLPDSSVRLSALTAKDQKDVAFGVRVGVDMMVLSFVSTAEDIQKLRELISREEKRQDIKEHTPIQVIAKVERADAIRHMESIVKEADGIMVGRGDLGVEIPEEEVPLRQKELTRLCRCHGKPVIVATQMLESMREHPKATRAEVSDAANAVIDHADAVMLSAESATGKYPVQAVETLHRVLLATEESAFDDVKPSEWCVNEGEGEWVEAMKDVLGKKPKAHAIVTATHYGAATMVNRPRPEVPIFVACDDARQAAQWALRWGVVPFVLKRTRATDTFPRVAQDALLGLGFIKENDKPLFLTGTAAKA